jgi:hypothetical protein
MKKNNVKLIPLRLQQFKKQPPLYISRNKNSPTSLETAYFTTKRHLELNCQRS